jgi:hypothetical protein
MIGRSRKAWAGVPSASAARVLSSWLCRYCREQLLWQLENARIVHHAASAPLGGAQIIELLRQQQ